MKTTLVAFGIVVALSMPSILVAQDPGFPTPQKEHEWLRQFVGEWDAESEGSMGPGQPTMKSKGTIKSRMLGGFWMISESEADVFGSKIHAIQTIGYDSEKKKYVGTWIDSMLSYLWRYDGTVDSAGKVLTLEAEGPNFMAAGKTTKFRDAYEFKSKDHIVATSSMQQDDGKWVTFMTGNLRRKK
jgi:hypothetical protein